MLRPALLSLALLCTFALAPFAARAPSAWADTPSGDAGTVDATAGSAAATPAPAPVDAAPAAAGSMTTPAPTAPAVEVVNPARAPVAAWDEVKEAKRTSWPLAVWLVLAMLGKALAYGRGKLVGVPVVGKLATWLAKGKGAMFVAAIGAIGAAGYNVLLDGGTWTAALVASGVAVAGVMHSTTKNATTGGTAPSVSPS